MYRAVSLDTRVRLAAVREGGGEKDQSGIRGQGGCFTLHFAVVVVPDACTHTYGVFNTFETAVKL